MNLITYPDRDALWLGLADALVSDLSMALSRGGRASLAVPGGTTPGPVFDILAGLDLDWARVDVMLTDERWVPETSPRSNTALLRARLLTGKAAPARLVPLYAEAETPEAALAALSEGVAACLPLGVVLLGMGADMHTASLFPGADQLAKALGEQAPALVAMRAPGAGEPRVTLSAPVLNGAMAKHLVILGGEKRAALDKAVALGDPMQAPVVSVLADLNVHWAEG